MSLSTELDLGYRETETIRQMHPHVRKFISDACAEDPDFMDGYLLPVLEGYPDPEEQITRDLADAAMAYGMAEAGLGSYEDHLGNLGKSFWKKIGKAIKKAVVAPVKFTAREIKKEVKAVEKVARKVGKVVDKTWVKYGGIILTVIGSVLMVVGVGAPILAAAAVVTAANTVYMKKRAAQRAKQAAQANAAQLQAEADAAEAATMRDCDAFYSAHQKWFVDNLGVGPGDWAKLTLAQKIGLIQSAASGKPPSGTPPEPVPAPPVSSSPPANQPPPSGGGSTSSGGGGGYAPPPSGGGGGDAGGGGGWPDSSSPAAGSAPPGAQPRAGQQVAQAGMFSGDMLPIIAVGVALALVFGKSTKGGGRRTRRNPRRMRRSA